MTNNIEISPIISGALPSDILRPRGKLVLLPTQLDNAYNFFEEMGRFFLVEGDGFFFELGVSSNGLFLERNNEYTLITPDMMPSGRLTGFIATWNPSMLRLIAFDKKENVINQIIGLTETVPVSVPISLKNWARDKSLIPTTVYESEEEFRNAVYQSISDLKAKIEEKGGVEAFWDYSYSGNKIEGKEPKKESMVQPLTLSLISTELYLRGIDIFRETETPNGDVDFTVVGAIENNRLAKMSIELKNSHSQKLKEGLLSQLPNYMRSQEAQYGVYLVLNYNLPDHRHSERGNLFTEISAMLFESKDPIVRNNIRVFTIDLDKETIKRKNSPD